MHLENSLDEFPFHANFKIKEGVEKTNYCIFCPICYVILK